MGNGRLKIFDVESNPIWEGEFQDYNDAAEALVRSAGCVAMWEQTDPACGDPECLVAMVRFGLGDSDTVDEGATFVFAAYGKGVQMKDPMPFEHPCLKCMERAAASTMKHVELSDTDS